MRNEQKPAQNLVTLRPLVVTCASIFVPSRLPSWDKVYIRRHYSPIFISVERRRGFKTLGLRMKLRSLLHLQYVSLSGCIKLQRARYT